MKYGKPKILAILPARSGSKRLKNKNILPICGKPMMGWTVDKIVKSKLIDKIVITTDIKEIISNRNYFDFIIKRPKELCKDSSPLDDGLRHAIDEEKKKGNEYDYIVMCHCNIPLRKEGEIDKLIKIALKNPEATAVCSGVEVSEPPEWMFEQEGKYFERLVGGKHSAFRKQDIPKRYNIDGSIQIHRVDALMKGDGTAYNYFGDKIIIVPHDKRFGLEIDCQEDFNYVEYLLTKEGGKNGKE